MKVAVLGAGSIGSIFTAYLAKAGMDVHVLARKQHRDAIKNSGLKLERIFDENSIHIDNISVINLFSTLNSFDLLLVTVKAFDVAKILDEISKSVSIDPEKQVIGLVQNGLGVEKVIRNAYPKLPLLRITTTNGALLKEPGTVQHTGLGDTHVGYWDEIRNANTKLVLSEFEQAFINSSLPVTVDENMVARVWKKLFINVAINAVGALFNVENGIIPKIKKMKEISDTLVDEALAVAAKGGFLNEFDAHSAALKVMNATSANRNSMLQDLDKGRKTEIDFINGAVSDHGKLLEVPTPWNDMITAAIQAKESIQRIQS